MNTPLSRRQFIQSCNIAIGAAMGAGLATGLGEQNQAEAAPQGALPIDTANSVSGAPSYVNPKRVLLWENTRREVRQAFESGSLKAIILPTGSIEQHNEHMALVADVAIATMISHQIALRMYPRVMVAPPSPCGYAPYHMARKGTVTLRKSTFLAYQLDVLDSLRAHGIRNMLVLNGHGGNHQPLREATPVWRELLPDVALEVASYFQGIPREYVAEITDSPQLTSHAGEFETSIYMAAFPERLRRVSMDEYDEAKLNYENGFDDKIVPFLKRDSRTEPGRLPGENGRDRRRQEESFLATAEKGEKLISKAVESWSQRLEEMIAATDAGQSWPPAE